MRLIRYLFLPALCLLSSMQVFGQKYASVSIEEDYDLLTERFSELAERLKSYGGLGEFCSNPDFRSETISVLSYLHHYDSLVLQILLDPTADLSISHREYRKAMSDIYKFEEEFSLESFMGLLKESCKTRNTLERDAEALRKESGIYSYDGQKLILETKLSKYVKHLVNRLTAIDEHVHLIHPDQLRNVRILAQQNNESY